MRSPVLPNTFLVHRDNWYQTVASFFTNLNIGFPLTWYLQWWAISRRKSRWVLQWLKILKEHLVHLFSVERVIRSGLWSLSSRGPTWVTQTRNIDRQFKVMSVLSSRQWMGIDWFMLHHICAKPIVVISSSDASWMKALRSFIAGRLREVDPIFSELLLMQLKSPVTTQGSTGWRLRRFAHRSLRDPIALYPYTTVRKNQVLEPWG